MFYDKRTLRSVWSFDENSNLDVQDWELDNIFRSHLSRFYNILLDIKNTRLKSREKDAGLGSTEKDAKLKSTEEEGPQ